MGDDQPPLFDMDPDPWEMDDTLAVARVVFPEGVRGVFDYSIPIELSAEVSAGKRLGVPLGRSNRTVEAYCVETINAGSSATSRRRLKSVARVVDSEPILSQSMLQVSRWIADYYLAPWGRVMEAVIPAGVRSGAGVRRLDMVRPTAAALDPHLRVPPKQAALLADLRSASTPVLKSQLLQRVGCTMAPLRSLAQKGLVRLDKVEVLQPPASETSILRESSSAATANPVQTDDHELTPSQAAAVHSVVDCVKSGTHHTFVLHGITGSGKTEVYIRTIKQVIRSGRQAIVLVPEISLTPQTRSRFRARFRRVAVLHSHLSDAERHWHWRNIAQGKVEVIVGARSAVFAPAPRLGLIVLDEEHDNSFKQDSIPRYHARDVASYRAEMERIPLILGSATPSLESWHRAESGRASRLSMPRRVLDRPLPAVMTIDLREDLGQRRGRGPISRRLDEAIRGALKRRQQIILLLNRRGFSTHIQCPACGHVVSCPACELPLTHHREEDRAKCHYCEHSIAAPPVCPECRFEGIRYSGLGTQRLEQEVRAKYPNAKVLRMDSDTMRKHGSHEVSLEKFRRGEVQILVGTQMIAKGLDFPNVTVVGIINADTGLHLPDFRASERTFQLVTQVAGRTGRGANAGCVYLQTYNPEHPAIRAAERHDFHQFAEHEMPSRQQFGYPPFGSMARIIVRGPVEAQVDQFSQHLAQQFQSLKQQQLGRVLGPAPAPIEKLRGHYRYHMVLQSERIEPIQRLVARAQETLQAPSDILWQVDVDPSEML